MLDDDAIVPRILRFTYEKKQPKFTPDLIQVIDYLQILLNFVCSCVCVCVSNVGHVCSSMCELAWPCVRL